ncbi:hypothetical protein [Salinirussus salinus]|uniref:hypothetical protein n=1 Tax=Salinirussus salinus TaxID=1198300 RepID=UPI00135B257D|nr:hypothetical protein [Salinirussus salinus]
MSPTYDRTDSDRYREVDRWEDGVGWLAHPEEAGRRVSHAVSTDEGVWVLDPLDAPGVDDLLAGLGEVAGVAVLSDYHARDAARFARRYDVPVTVPGWLDRVPDRLDCRVDRVEDELAGFALRPLRPLYAWREVAAYREADGTLYVPDYLSTHDAFTVGPERLGLPTLGRLFPSRERFADCEPERVLVGHGAGVFEDADAALAVAFEGARQRFPRALLRNGPREFRAMAGALLD